MPQHIPRVGGHIEIMKQPRLDVLSVGDAATDVFIRVSNEHVRVREDDHGHWMDLSFGGQVPFDYALTVAAGGNAANAAVGFSRLGLSTAIATHLGSDKIGRGMEEALHREEIDTHLVRFDREHPSNRNFVLWFGQDRTILVHHQPYDYVWPHLSPRETPRWVYLSSVGAHAHGYFEQIMGWLESEPAVRLALQPGTVQIAQGHELYQSLYRRADILICNREEAVDLTGGDHGNLGDLLARLHGIGPRAVVVTDGPDGAYASDGTRRYRVPAYPDPAPPVERTGAGDAFASTLVAALVRDLPFAEAMARAPVNAMHAVQEVGSQTGLLGEAELLELLSCAPDGFCVTSW